MKGTLGLLIVENLRFGYRNYGRNERVCGSSRLDAGYYYTLGRVADDRAADDVVVVVVDDVVVVVVVVDDDVESPFGNTVSFDDDDDDVDEGR